MTPNYSGSLSGLMNTCANMAGGIAPVLTAYIATRFGWPQALDFAALVSFSAGVIWLFVNADANLEGEAPIGGVEGALLAAGGPTTRQHR
jgi:sugar phosphate permease